MLPGQWEALRGTLAAVSPLVTGLIGLWLGHRLTLRREKKKRQQDREEAARARRDAADLILGDWERLETRLTFALRGEARSAIPLEAWVAARDRLLAGLEANVALPVMRFFGEIGRLEHKREAAARARAVGPLVKPGDPMAPYVASLMKAAKDALEAVAKPPTAPGR